MIGFGFFHVVIAHGGKNTQISKLMKGKSINEKMKMTILTLLTPSTWINQFKRITIQDDKSSETLDSKTVLSVTFVLCWI